MICVYEYICLRTSAGNFGRIARTSVFEVMFRVTVMVMVMVMVMVVVVVVVVVVTMTMVMMMAMVRNFKLLNLTR